MSSRHMKMDEIKERAQAAFEKSEQRKRDSLLAWQAHEDEAQQRRAKTEKLRAMRLAKEAEDAVTKAAEVAAKAPVKRATKAAAKDGAAPARKPAAKPRAKVAAKA